MQSHTAFCSLSEFYFMQYKKAFGDLPKAFGFLKRETNDAFVVLKDVYQIHKGNFLG